MWIISIALHFFLGYLNDRGTLVLSRFEIFMRKLDRVCFKTRPHELKVQA